MGSALGIDLGTTNSVAAVATATSVDVILDARGERVPASVIALPERGGRLIGADATLTRLAEPPPVSGPASIIHGPAPMSSKAIIYDRKAERSLRQALAEVQASTKNTP